MTKNILRKELEAEFVCLKEFGVTEEELEALYKMCGLVKYKTIIFNTKKRGNPQEDSK